MEQNHSRYLTEKDVSQITGFSLSTLRNHRFQRRGLSYYKIGRTIRYDHAEVMDFMARHRVELSKGGDS